MQKLILLILLPLLLASCKSAPSPAVREKILLNSDWYFFKYDSTQQADALIYDVRPPLSDTRDDKPADAQPTEALQVEADVPVLKPWILPSGNAFIKNPAQHHQRPEGQPGSDFPFVQGDFDDSAWEHVDLPHDWAIAGPFMEGWEAEVGGGMGRLPSHGVAWYRKKLDLPQSDAGRQIVLEIEGAMSYAMVWLNGQLVGGWPYGYNSFQLDLSPYVHFGGENQLAIRIDNPPHSSRWYPGGGLYRNVWLHKTEAVHVAQWGTYITTPKITEAQATVEIETRIANHLDRAAPVKLQTEIFYLGSDGQPEGPALAFTPEMDVLIQAHSETTVKAKAFVAAPLLWGPPPTQTPHRYRALTTLKQNGETLDRYATNFGIRTLDFDGEEGLKVNGERIFIKGVNQHHDLGALGAAFNRRAAERQLQLLAEMGCNAIRMAHNPPAPELLALTDSMGFLVVNEIYDSWERKKTPWDFHLIFPDWHEQDLRAFVRRDRNHPSVVLWSYGNEVGEQYTEEAGAELSRRLRDIVRDEDPSRPTTVSMNYAKPHMPFSGVADVINLNYQGEGIRNTPAHAHLTGIRTDPLYPAFHQKYPDKLILSSENAAAISSRGTYLFPVAESFSSPVSDGQGGDSKAMHVSAYELYAVDFGSSADKVFATKDQHPYVGGGFVWSGWDYLGEPTPYYLARSSYFGIIDLAGFKKDRYYLYQSRWRPELPMVHLLPHWNWPGREGQPTPVHVFTSGDEVELFLNGQSLGRQQKEPYEYRLRWDELRYTPGELKAVAYKNGAPWAETRVVTTGAPTALQARADRSTLQAEASDLAFVSVEVCDADGNTVPNAHPLLTFSLEGPGEIVATDNGDPSDMTAFPSLQRKAFNGKCLVIIRPQKGKPGTLQLTVSAKDLESATVRLQSE